MSLPCRGRGDGGVAGGAGFRGLCGIVVWLAVAATCAAEDWPQFGGPRRDFTSPETGLARSWPAEGPKLLWKVPLHKGFAGASVFGGEVFLFDQAGDREVLLCLDLATGKELWRFDDTAPNTIRPAGARATPAVDREYVFVCGTTGRLHALDRKTRKVVWRADLVKDFDGTVPKWGVAQNPALWRNLVIVAPQGRQGGVVAFDRGDGRVVWKSPYLRSMITGNWEGSYISPALTEIDGVPQAIMATAHGPRGDDGTWSSRGVAAGISLADGSVLWTYDGWQSEIPIPAPVPVGDGRVFLTAAYGSGSAMIRVRKTGDTFAATELCKTMECGAQIQQPILFRDHLYVVSNGKERKEGLMCLGLDGQVKWHTTRSGFCAKAAPGLPNFECGNILLADGLLFAVDGKQGDVYLIEPSPQGYRQLACVKKMLDEGEDGQVWAPMALSQGRLLLRDQRQMKCLDVSAAAGR
jgi:outer membrane protein assembly factor BamB